MLSSSGHMTIDMCGGAGGGGAIAPPLQWEI